MKRPVRGPGDPGKRVGQPGVQTQLMWYFCGRQRSTGMGIRVLVCGLGIFKSPAQQVAGTGESL